MLMLCHKTRATNERSLYGRHDQMNSNLLSQLRQGLKKVVAALENYSLSFEALNGMRGKNLFLHQLPEIGHPLDNKDTIIANCPLRSSQRGNESRLS